jgi:mono/diheme cytochrome c family protein
MGTHRTRILGRLASSCLAPGLLIASLALAASKGQDPDDDEEAKFFGRQAFVENCLICHGEGMTSRSRLTAKQWSAEVDKMIGWGAPVPPERKASLLAYLVGSFSDKVPPPAPDTASPDELLAEDSSLVRRPIPVGDAPRGASLYTQHCAICHGPEGQGGDLGPRLAGRAVLLDDALYHETVRKGRRRMPGFSNVLKPDAEDDLLGWLRSASSARGR